MKFGKSLSNQIEETLPEWRDKFLSYKELKKRLKLIEPNNNNSTTKNNGDPRPLKKPRFAAAEGGRGDCNEGSMTKEEIDFIKLLDDELEKFNSFFVEKEEEYIIRLKELQDSVAKAINSNEEMIKIRKEIVDFHGEMVLLENYSALNYTGLVKILKKYDKRTGALIRLPFIQRVLQQPFFTTDLLYKLVKECEAMLDGLLPLSDGDDDLCGDPSTSSTTTNDGLLRFPRELAEIELMESSSMKSTISALRVLKEIRSKSSTVSVFSLPPLQISGLEDAWKKVPILEQEAK
ncbi:PREDICTED: SPX domain-containing protein 1-like [Populus euphratica]|uniref:SPX domain-containing protein 1-like n=1 Tax=Populus euphratica TaxID=75702 RepID=A0AAJ6XG54_POPEU|nr:PREDICTED: SPX domain-containing protein 1-like [Populus euphratica]